MGDPAGGEAVVTRFLHVAVLMGGPSLEREVSLTSGRQVAAALEERGHRVSAIDYDADLPFRLRDLNPDVVFNALHGVPGEDGSVQGCLDVLGVPYTHSGCATSAVAIDKELTKAVLTPHGIPMPVGVVVDSETLYEGDPLPRPYVLKPLNEGSSVGVAIITEGGNHGNPIARRATGPWTEFSRLLAEPFIPGRELTTGVLNEPGGPRALGVTELKPKSGFYDYDAKYTDGLTDHVCPADLPATIADRCEEIALDAHRVLGCRGCSRSDFRWDEERGADGLFLLEVNTQPGMTPLSLLPEQAAVAGIDYPSLVERLIEAAL